MEIKSYFQHNHQKTDFKDPKIGVCGEIWAIGALSETQIITGSVNGTLRLYNITISSKKIEHKFKKDNAHGEGISINSITICDDKSFISCAETGSIIIWNVQDNQIKLVQEIKYHNQSVTKVILLKDNLSFASCSHDKTIKFWSKQSPYTLCAAHPCITNWNKVQSIVQLLVKKDQNLLVVSCGSNCGFITVWNLKTVQRLGSIPDVFTANPNGLIELTNGNIAVSQNDPAQIVIIDPYSIKIIKTIINKAIIAQSSLLVMPNSSFVYVFEGNYVQIDMNNYNILKAFYQKVKPEEKKDLQDLNGTAGLLLLEKKKYIVTNNNSLGLGFFTY